MRPRPNPANGLPPIEQPCASAEPPGRRCFPSDVPGKGFWGPARHAMTRFRKPVPSGYPTILRHSLLNPFEKLVQVLVVQAVEEVVKHLLEAGFGIEFEAGGFCGTAGMLPGAPRVARVLGGFCGHEFG